MMSNKDRDRGNGWGGTLAGVLVGYLVYDRIVKPWIDKGGADKVLEKIGGKSKQPVEKPEIETGFKPEIV